MEIMTDYIIWLYVVPFIVMVFYEIVAIKKAQRKKLQIRPRFLDMLGRCALPGFNLLFACWLLSDDILYYFDKYLKWIKDYGNNQ